MSEQMYMVRVEGGHVSDLENGVDRVYCHYSYDVDGLIDVFVREYLPKHCVYYNTVSGSTVKVCVYKIYEKGSPEFDSMIKKIKIVLDWVHGEEVIESRDVII